MPDDDILPRDFLEAGALDAVETQRLLDAHYEQAVCEWADSGMPRELCPRSYRISSFELSARTRIQLRRKTGLKLVLVPLGVGAELRHEIATTSVLRLTVEVLAAPPHDAALSPE